MAGDERVISELIVEGARKFIQDYVEANQAVTKLTTTLQSAERVRTPQLAPGIGQINTAFANANRSANQFQDQLIKVAQASTTTTASFGKKTKAIADQASEERKATTSGITYLSVLSAIHAASFLATNTTFSMIGSFTTLGLAFSKLGPVAAGVGLVFGGFLAIFGQVAQAMQLIQTTALTLVGVLATVGVAGAAAFTALGTIGVQAAANVESQFAVIQAVTGATRQSLSSLNEIVTEVALRFGISSAAVAEAASLFIRAGGNITSAISGATQAVIQLQVASAGELQAAQAALAVAAGLNAFSLAGEEAVRVANAIAGAAQASALSFTGITQAFIQAVPGARTLGITLEDTAAVIALLGNELVKGTITGTSFKQFLLDLINPSKESAAELAKFGVSIKTADGTIRPLIDILDNLNQALGDQAVESGKVTAAERARAIAQIFGSRAALAGNILTREGAAGLQEFREKLQGVTATNITDVLLLPLNKQLERLKITVEEVGRAFGNPLLQPIRNTVTSAIQLVQSIIPITELVGQAIAVIATGQGFGELQQQISKVADNQRVAIFIIELVNSFRNLRDVIVGTIVPAIQEFLVNLGLVGAEPGRLTDVVTTFQNINKAIVLTGAVIAGAIRAFSELVTQIIHNEGKGKDLRDTLASIATIIATNLITSLATTGVFLAVTLKIMEGLGNTIRTTVLPNLDKFGNALIIVGKISTLLIDQLSKPFVEAARAAAFAAHVIAGFGLDEAAKAANAAADAARGPIHALTQGTEELGRALTALSKSGESGLGDVDKLLADARAQAQNTIKSFEDLAGQIPDAFSNLRAELEDAQRQAASGPTGTEPDLSKVVDTKAIEQAAKRIEEAGRDLSRRLANLAEDSATRVSNIIQRSVERLDDIREKSSIQLQKLARDTQQRIDEIQEAIFQRRDDRTATDEFTKFIDDRLKAVERGLDSEARLEEKTVERARLARQRGNEDVQRSVDQAFAIVERGFQQQQDAAERSFQRTQQARERAADLADSVAEKQFQRQQDREATARDNQLKLAAAKTPQDRTNVLAQIDQAAKDVQFRQSQENAFDTFKQAQDKKRLDRQQQAEQASIGFRQGLETAAIKERQKQEQTLLQFRRQQENIEIQVREKEEETQLTNRLGRETRLLEHRKQNEQLLRNFQDNLENQATARQVDKVNREAGDRAKDIAEEAKRQAQEVFDQAQIQLNEQTSEIDKTIRNISQALGDIADSLPPEVLAAVFGQLATAQAQVAIGSAKVITGFEAERDAALAAISAQQAVLEAQLIVATPRFAPPTLNDLQGLQPTIPLSVVTAQVLHAASIVLPAGFSDSVSQAVLNGMQQAADRGLLTQDTPEIDLTPIVEPLQSMQRFFGA